MTDPTPNDRRSPAMIPLAEAQAMVAAACEGLVNEAAGMADGRDEAAYIERKMRALTPADARAALDRLIAEAEERGRREAYDIAHTEIVRLMDLPTMRDSEIWNDALQAADNAIAAAIRAEG